jgi:hypothetical protein
MRFFGGVLLAVVAMLPGLGGAQVAESVVRGSTAPGFQLPKLGGSLSYAVNASESVSTGFYNQGDGPSVATNITGDLAYLSESRVHPFSAIYSGGVLAGNENQPTSVVQNLALSQVLITRLFDFTVTNSLNYLPATASTGLSGVAGQGDMGVDPPVTGPVTGQGALTSYAPRVSNGTTASVVRTITGKTSVQASGSFVLQRFTGDDAAGLIDSNQVVGSGGASHILDARTSVSAGYSLSKITYSPDLFASAFEVQSLNFGYSRKLNRSLSVNASLGPQWVHIAAGGGRTALDLATDVVLQYGGERSSASASYVRGTNNGFGVTPGGFSDSVNTTARRSFFRIWSAAATGNYTQTSEPSALDLPNYALGTLVAGVQVSRAISRTVSTYASYNAQRQTVSGAADVAVASGAFRGLFQVVAFGLTYSPHMLSFGENR